MFPKATKLVHLLDAKTQHYFSLQWYAGGFLFFCLIPISFSTQTIPNLLQFPQTSDHQWHQHGYWAPNFLLCPITPCANQFCSICSTKLDCLLIYLWRLWMQKSSWLDLREGVKVLSNAEKPQGETLWYNVNWSPDSFLLSFSSSLDFLLQLNRRKPFSWTSLKTISLSGISKLWSESQIQSSASEAKNGFGILKWLKKVKRRAVSCAMKITWNSSFSVQQSFIGTQPHSLPYLLSVAAFMLMMAELSCDGDHTTYKAGNTRYLKKFVIPCSISHNKKRPA